MPFLWPSPPLPTVFLLSCASRFFSALHTVCPATEGWGKPILLSLLCNHSKMVWIQGKTELFLSETEVRGHQQLRLQGWGLKEASKDLVSSAWDERDSHGASKDEKILDLRMNL